MTDVAGACLFIEARLGDQGRGNPFRPAIKLRADSERARAPHPRVEGLLKIFQDLFGEARADIACVMQHALRIVYTQQQRAEAGASSSLNS